MEISEYYLTHIPDAECLIIWTEYLSVLLLVIILECDCQMVRDVGLVEDGRGVVGGEGKGSSIIRPFK